jgi:adenylyl cyclase-associated protein
MTHKNPELRAGSMVKEDDIKKGSPKKAWTPPAAVKAPVLECQGGGKKWVVEHHKGNNDIVIDNVNMKQTIYIYKCENSTIQIKGKINSITLDSCKKVGMVYGDVVSTVDIVNCQSVQVQSQGVVPTIGISKTDGCQVYLSESSLNAEIVTSKSSEMNVLVPSANGFDEFPVPEQFKTVFDGKKFVTAVAELV